jgi:hypothetical protein
MIEWEFAEKINTTVPSLVLNIRKDLDQPKLVYLVKKIRNK